MAASARTKSGRDLPLYALSKIRNELLVMRAMTASQSFSSSLQDKVVRQYNNGESIFDISLAAGQPAMACFRIVLKARNLGPAQVQ
jgi:hypothetical protein